MKFVFVVVFVTTTATDIPLLALVEDEPFTSLEACETFLLQNYLGDGWKAERMGGTTGRILVYNKGNPPAAYSCHGILVD